MPSGILFFGISEERRYLIRMWSKCGDGVQAGKAEAFVWEQIAVLYLWNRNTESGVCPGTVVILCRVCRRGRSYGTG